MSLTRRSRWCSFRSNSGCSAPRPRWRTSPSRWSTRRVQGGDQRVDGGTGGCRQILQEGEVADKDGGQGRRGVVGFSEVESDEPASDDDDASTFEAASKSAFTMTWEPPASADVQMFFEKVLRGENAPRGDAVRAARRREPWRRRGARGRCGWRRWRKGRSAPSPGRRGRRSSRLCSRACPRLIASGFQRNSRTAAAAAARGGGGRGDRRDRRGWPTDRQVRPSTPPSAPCAVPGDDDAFVAARFPRPASAWRSPGG